MCHPDNSCLSFFKVISECGKSLRILFSLPFLLMLPNYCLMVLVRMIWSNSHKNCVSITIWYLKVSKACILKRLLLQWSTINLNYLCSFCNTFAYVNMSQPLSCLNSLGPRFNSAPSQLLFLKIEKALKDVARIRFSPQLVMIMEIWRRWMDVLIESELKFLDREEQA